MALPWRLAGLLEGPYPTGFVTGSSPSLRNCQPQCSSLPGRVRAHTGCVTTSSTVDSSPLRVRTATQREAHGQARDTYST